MSRAPQLIDLIADGRWHAGPALAGELAVTRATVSARVRAFQRMGVAIYAVSGKGYRLARPLELLCPPAIRAALAPEAARRVADIVVHRQVDSTNAEVERCDDGLTRACFAEYQSAGRGRGGRYWASPFASNIYVSLIHRVHAPPGPVAALGLKVAVALARALRAAGVADIGLKWPNDLWVAGAKLGGILSDYRGEAGGAARLIIGVGLNVEMSAGQAQAIEQRWTRLADHWPAPEPRNQIAARVLGALVAGIAEFEARGASGLPRQWSCFDVLAGKPVCVHGAATATAGIARGVDEDGSLRIETASGATRAYSGDVSVRATT